MAGNNGDAQLSDNSIDAENAQGTPKKRKRTAHACDNCRTRKTRCDGQAPCSTCRASDLACTHGMETVSKGKSDLVLAAVLRMERSLEQLDSKVSACMSMSPSSMIRSPDRGTGQVASARASHSLSPSQTAAGHIDASAPEPVFRAWLASVENASISRLHTSTTESILAWPHFDCYAELRNADRHASASVFELEQARSAAAATSAPPMLPFTSSDEIESIVESFQQNINFWYPTLAKSHLDQITDKILRGALGNDCESCLALLVMALGCACDMTTSALGNDSDVAAVERLASPRSGSERTPRPHSHKQKMAGLYFDCAMSRLHFAYQEVSRSALQCLMYTAFYHGSAQKPLQAWSLINATATKCRVLLSYKPNGTTHEDEECIRRIFWSCFILESDYLAELSALPLSGISDMESSVLFPGNYHTHDSVTQEEQSALYFLACLSMRRLLNRVHHLLYSKDTGASLDDSRFPKMVAELDHQLEEWRLLLPSRFQFTLDRQPAANQHAGFLRQRYLTCRSVIYRPYLMRMLGAGRNVDQDIREKCRKCLDACIDHILNLRGFSHTVFMDTWICSLSMAAAMLILLAAHRVPSVKASIGPEVTMLGQHLSNLLKRWIKIPGSDPSPSTQQAIRWIEVADKLIKDEARGESLTAPSPLL